MPVIPPPQIYCPDCKYEGQADTGKFGCAFIVAMVIAIGAAAVFWVVFPPVGLVLLAVAAGVLLFMIVSRKRGTGSKCPSCGYESVVGADKKPPEKTADQSSRETGGPGR
ncbi:MAG: hypothetical protein ACLFOY_07595 [Desulfatibacillaceae bacterium]